MQSVTDNNTGAGYIKSLDGLRAVAIIFVVFFHSPLPLFKLGFGWAGVNLFFILSGFLITRILLHTASNPFPVYVKNFYLRRILRIFPLYFFYLLIAALILFGLNTVFAGSEVFVSDGLSDLQRNYPLLLTYTYNFHEFFNYMANKSYNGSVFFGHLWSLSVEEQFYLLFPLLLYFLPVKKLNAVLLLTIALVPFLRLLAVYWLRTKGQDPFWTGSVLYAGTFFQLDTLALGACLAIFDCKKWVQYGWKILCLLLILLAVAGFVHLYTLQQFGLPAAKRSLGFDEPAVYLLYMTPYKIINHRYFYVIPLINLAFATLLLLCINRKIWPSFFENKLMVAIGKISYGIYMYHLVFSYLYELAFRKIARIDIAAANMFFQVLLMGVYLVLLYVIAWFSYMFFERRFLRMRGRLVFH